jgi:hypothetical protein
MGLELCSIWWSVLLGGKIRTNIQARTLEAKEPDTSLGMEKEKARSGYPVTSKQEGETEMNTVLSNEDIKAIKHVCLFEYTDVPEWTNITMAGVIYALEVEIQRADKAEAEIVELRGQLLEAKYAFDCLAIETDDEPFIDHKQTAKAFRKKLCDEIVGKIEARQEAIIKQKPWLDLDGYLDSIDIVKSVLSEEG